LLGKGTSIRSGGDELVLSLLQRDQKLIIYTSHMFANKNGREKNRRGNEITLRFTTGHIFYLIIFFFQQGRQSY
jgi:hypothetical protein